MERSTKEAWLTGPGDLQEADVSDVPVEGQSVRVRGLPAAYSNEASSEALEWATVGEEQVARVNSHKLEVLQFTHGVIEPQFSQAEAEIVAKKFGPAFKKVIAKIDELSGVDKQSIEEAQARFPAGGGPEAGETENGNGAGAGGERSPVPARTGA